MTPEQYRREGAEAMQDAALKSAEDRTPSKHGGALAAHVAGTAIQKAIRAIDVDEVLAGLHPAPDPVARLVEAAEQLKKTTWVSHPNAALIINRDYWDAFCNALAAMETSHDRT